MNKKLLTILGVAVMASGCFNNTSTNSEPAKNSTTHSSSTVEVDPYDTVLADTSVHSWVVHGPNKVGDEVNGWDDKSNDLFKKSAMTAISINQASEINADLGATLKTKDVKHLYTLDVEFGTTAAGWTTRVMKADGKIYDVDGSYAMKVGKVNYSEKLDSYATGQWVPDPKTAHVESLTPATFFVPTWQETPDENGFAWNQNPAVIGGAGLYTLVAAEYNAVSAEDTPGYGFALILKEAKEAATEDQEYVAPAEDSYGIVGTINGWGTPDVAMTKGADGSYSGSVTLVVNDEFKVRVNEEWTTCWGASAVKNAPEGAFDLTGDNIKCLADGTYTIRLYDIDGNNASIDITAA